MKKISCLIAAVILIVLGFISKQYEEAEISSQVGSIESNIKVESMLGSESTVGTHTTESGEVFEEDYIEYYFRNDNLLKQHYEKHGVEMGFDSMEEYEEAACAVIYNPDVLTKTEKEDGDYVYYVEESNEFVVLSQDGYIRTYFNPSAGIDYYNRQ